uniref:Ribosomal biogenesis protein LAS1L isoform X2 n=1 Tax=Pogona vitticeps TaxID=103695 RepID=A0ABM5EWE9_9SAUR
MPLSFRGLLGHSRAGREPRALSARAFLLLLFLAPPTHALPYRLPGLATLSLFSFCCLVRGPGGRESWPGLRLGLDFEVVGRTPAFPEPSAESSCSMASGPRSTRPGQRPAGGKSPRKRPRSVVAWQSKAEWDQVMVGLYCGDCQLQRDALDRVSVWKSRYGHRMPLAVECTADLVRCKILDASDDMKSHELVLMYGLALVRFTNLITERKQKKFNISLRWLAKELDIPVWIVDLRHELTHGKLPPLATCRKGCDVVLEWLRRSYWSRQLSNGLAGAREEEEDDELSNSESGTDSSQEEPEKSSPSPISRKHLELLEKVTDVLISYKNHQLKALQQLQDVQQACRVWCSSSSEVEWVVAQLKDLLQENRNIVARALLDDGFLIPSADELQTLKINEQDTSEWDLSLPRPFLRFWQPLLKGLHSKDFTQALLEKMFAELQKKPAYSQAALRPQYLITWIAKILKANMQAKKKKKKSPLALFSRHVSLQWLKLLEDCLEATCWASPHLLHLILSGMDPPLPPDSQEKLLYLTSIYTQDVASFGSPGSATELHKQPIYTVESLQWKMKHSGLARGLGKRARREEMPLGKEEEEEGEKGDEEADDNEDEEQMDAQPAARDEPSLVESPVALAEKRMALQGSVWQVSSDGVEWKSFPLGRLPGQTDDPDTLLVNNYSMMSALDQVVTRDRKISPIATTLEWSSSGAEGLLWTQSELHKLKSGLQLF